MINKEVAGEVWKDIPGYEGYYKVSDKGRILSLVGWNGHKYVKRERIINGWIQATDSTGTYKRRVVRLSKNGKKREVKIHRIVASVFFENKENKPEVNHIDGNTLNNRRENLEWVTSSENKIHAWRTGLRGENVYDFEGEIIEDYKKGVLAKELEEKYNSNWITIKRILKENNVRIISMSERKTIYGIDKSELAKDFERGMRNVDIAKKYGANRHLIGVYKYKHKKGELI